MIFGVFSGLVDGRGAHGKRYEFEALLCAVMLSMLAGSFSLAMELIMHNSSCRWSDGSCHRCEKNLRDDGIANQGR